VYYIIIICLLYIYFYTYDINYMVDEID